jgi:hypothetical protein
MKSIYFIALLAIFLSTACFAITPSSGEGNSWKAECVGRYQVNLPGTVEVALNSSKHFLDDSGSNFYRFSDDTIAYFSAGYDVYPMMNQSEALQFISSFKNRFDKNKEQRSKESKTPFDAKIAYWLTFHDVVNNRDAAWVEPGFYSLFIFRDGHFFNFGSNFDKTNNSAKDTEKSIAGVNTILNTFQPRPIYTLPNQPGVCIPYGFIADDGNASSDIAVTMRLIDHPDVEIFFEDGAPTRDPKMAITLFFDGYVNGEKGIKADFLGYRSITMSGQKGKALFVTITRTDDTKDYGYVAYVEGDTAASSKMLYVIRTAARAKGEPASKDELKDMSEKIMASVKPHGVK